MSDLISKEAVLEIIDNETRNTSDYLQHNTQINIRFAVDELPTVEAKPVVRGEWLYERETYNTCSAWKCSNCGECYGLPFIKNEYNFCPNCGTDMRKGGVNNV